MDDDTEGGGLPRELRMAIVLLVMALAAAGVMLLVNFQISRAIVGQAEQFRQDMEGERQRGNRPGPGRPDAGANIPGPVHPGPGRHADPFNPGPSPSEDGATAAPIVKAGDESARPPRRGSVNGP
jgi:hypothetical protein